MDLYNVMNQEERMLDSQAGEYRGIYRLGQKYLITKWTGEKSVHTVKGIVNNGPGLRPALKTVHEMGYKGFVSVDDIMEMKEIQ